MAPSWSPARPEGTELVPGRPSEFKKKGFGNQQTLKPNKFQRHLKSCRLIRKVVVTIYATDFRPNSFAIQTPIE